MSAQVWQYLIFSLPTHKLRQASRGKGLNTSSYKALPNLCLLTREAFWKGLRSTENLFASFKKESKLHLCISGHTHWNNFWNGDYTKKNVLIYMLKHWNQNAVPILYIISQCYKTNFNSVSVYGNNNRLY